MKKKRLLFPFTNPVSLLTGTVRDYLGILALFVALKNPEAVDLQQLPVSAGNRT